MAGEDIEAAKKYGEKKYTEHHQRQPSEIEINTSDKVAEYLNNN